MFLKLLRPIVLALICLSVPALKGLCGEPVLVDPYQAGSQYLAYPVPKYGIPTLTAAPEGYEPFHIEHYGRHGSRWLLSDSSYIRPVMHLEKAERNGKLTPRGQQLLAQLRQIRDASKNRIGELTPLGHRQHRDIARRMTQNFPEIFHAGTYVDAKSTVVIRCILSMHNEIAELERLIPGIITKADASRFTQKTLAYNSSDTVARQLASEKFYLVDEYADRFSDLTAFQDKLFTDKQFVADSIDLRKAFEAIFDVAVNTQSHDDQADMYDIFTPRELHEMWMVNNAWWYINSGNTQLTNNRVPYCQRVLLRNIIASADTAMTSPRHSVNLRFGHESIVLPLTILLEANNSDYDTESLETLEDNWRNYEIFAMASNLQLIFYRPTGKADYSADDVLVKLLLNEAEATLPATPVTGPYYRWTDLRQYYLDKMSKID